MLSSQKKVYTKQHLWVTIGFLQRKAQNDHESVDHVDEIAAIEEVVAGVNCVIKSNEVHRGFREFRNRQIEQLQCIPAIAHPLLT